MKHFQIQIGKFVKNLQIKFVWAKVITLLLKMLIADKLQQHNGEVLNMIG